GRATELVHRRHVSLHDLNANLIDFSVYGVPPRICAVPVNDCRYQPGIGCHAQGSIATHDPQGSGG
ncbi:hypothetical protein NL487_26785, partial [Klebsiella pneumoniae]|nr:hypothetical protein [Klebsiella pneumoniae]